MELYAMAKKRKAANTRASRRRPARRRASADQTVNTLVILVVIVIVLGGLYLYAQNKKQAPLRQSLSPAIAAVVAPFKAALTPQAVAIAPAAQPVAALAQQSSQPPERTRRDDGLFGDRAFTRTSQDMRRFRACTRTRGRPGPRTPRPPPRDLPDDRRQPRLADARLCAEAHRTVNELDRRE